MSCFEIGYQRFYLIYSNNPILFIFLNTILIHLNSSVAIYINKEGFYILYVSIL